MLKRQSALIALDACAALVAGVLFGVACLPTAVAGAGRVIGHLDGIAHDGKQAFISGWACQQGQNESMPIHIYANLTPADPTKIEFLSANETNFDNEAAVNKACQD
jgi:hypothetical protein